jgi:hypothetical protein
MTGRLIHVEQEQLDHQRARLEEILAGNQVSPVLKSDLRRLLDDIGLRLWEISAHQAGQPSYLMQH